MMAARLYIVAYTCFLMHACAPDTPAHNVDLSLEEQARIHGDSLRVALYTRSIDSLKVQLDTLIDSAFDYVTSNFSYGVYLHKHWKGEPVPATNSLTCVVNTWTGYHFISNLRQARSVRHNRVLVHVGDSVVEADDNDGLPLCGTDWRPLDGTTNYTSHESRLLYPYPSEDVGNIILSQPATEIVISAYCDDDKVTHYTVPEEDRQAILMSLQLADLIQRIRDMENERAHLRRDYDL